VFDTDREALSVLSDLASTLGRVIDDIIIDVTCKKEV
jgi:hypothetical protein